jgi:CspA family cold shock protein
MIVFHEMRSYMPHGRIKWYSPVKGYGFIIPDQGADELFFHYTSMLDTGNHDFSKGDRVSFDESQGEKGLKALNIKLLIN